MKFLIVDDDVLLADALALGFKGLWPDAGVFTARNGVEALRLFAQEKPDLIVLDVNMPDMDGFHVLARVRERSDVPVIMLTVQDEEAHKVRALDAGADDYITKPFGVMELVARIRAVLRRGGEQIVPSMDSTRTTIGDLGIDHNTGRVTLKGEEIELTPIEYQVLIALAKQPGRVLSRDTILAQVWGPEYRGETSLVKTYVRRLRQKTEVDPNNPRLIITDGRRGYRLGDPSEI